ncbi:helicase-related protein [Bradyrhizobium yuanmingense]|uniref:helicase-related protein n=1 Tax=Bradyrhizobium yuanmingense TaxID=108015 RepID=UPI001F0AC9BE|nr:helicase-related protein [Bradyrhizobium yuanmingense]
MSGRLRRSLEGGVAFHNGDLTRDERVAVERGFGRSDGGIHVLVATSTVAAGVNTPASTVIIVETAFPGGGEPTPYTVAQFKNMAGRAGRLGYEPKEKQSFLQIRGSSARPYSAATLKVGQKPSRHHLIRTSPAPGSFVSSLKCETFPGRL